MNKLTEYNRAKELTEKDKFWVKVKNNINASIFYLIFDSEFERDKYIRRSKYFTNIKIIDYDDIYKFNCGR